MTDEEQLAEYERQWNIYHKKGHKDKSAKCPDMIAWIKLKRKMGL